MRWFWLLLFLCCVFQLPLEAKEKPISMGIDSSYITEFKTKYLLASSAFIRSAPIVFNPKNEQALGMVYQTNSPLRLGFLAGYKNFRLGFSFILPSYLNANDQSRGFSFQFKTQLPVNNLGLDFLIRKEVGYYLDNYADFYPNWAKYPYKPFYPNMEIRQLSFNTHMVFSKKFSLKAVLNQSQRQLKSAGGFGLQMGMNYFSLRTDTAMIPYGQEAYYGDLGRSSSMGKFGFNISPGYAYTFVRNDFFASTVFFGGLSFDLQKLKFFGGGFDVNLIASPQLYFIQAIGYNSESGFLSLSYSFSGSYIPIDGDKLRNGISLFSLNAGIRF